MEFDITRAWPDQLRATVLFNDVRQPANQATNKEDRARRIRGQAVGDLQSRHCKVVLRTQAMCDFNSGHELVDVSNCGAHLGNVSHDRQQANRSGIAGRIELVRKSWEVRQLGNASDVATRDARSAELDAMSAAGVATIAQSLGIEHKNKADSMVAILDIEYPS